VRPKGVPSFAHGGGTHRGGTHRGGTSYAHGGAANCAHRGGTSFAHGGGNVCCSTDTISNNDIVIDGMGFLLRFFGLLR
jgi:hypothetical protein